jgi:cellulose synthase/poly-beta-1,6-N-acetylglucosamine synthase-like glycosyltransferase
MAVLALTLLLDLLLAIYILAVLTISATAIRGLRLLPVLQEGRPGHNSKVSVILPVKDEADTLDESLQSLVNLDYPNKEIIVVSAESHDGTSEIIQRYGGQVKIVSEPPRPEGWRGKCWACHAGFLASSGDVLLFTDGDVTHSPKSLSSTLAHLEKDDVSLLSVWPKVVTRVSSERMLFPVGSFFLSTAIAAGATKKTDRGRLIRGANGQYILITREAYVAVGGYEAVRDSIVEDATLGRKAADAGLLVHNLDGKDFMTVKPYSSFREIWVAFERFSAGLLQRLRYLILVATLSLLYFTSPVVVLAVGLAASSVSVATCGLAAVLLSYGTTLAFYRKNSHARYTILTPVAGLIMVAAFIRGFGRFSRGGIEWKAQRYRK